MPNRSRSNRRNHPQTRAETNENASFIPFLAFMRPNSDASNAAMHGVYEDYKNKHFCLYCIGMMVRLLILFAIGLVCIFKVDIVCKMKSLESDGFFDINNYDGLISETNIFLLRKVGYFVEWARDPILYGLVYYFGYPIISFIVNPYYEYYKWPNPYGIDIEKSLKEMKYVRVNISLTLLSEDKDLSKERRQKVHALNMRTLDEDRRKYHKYFDHYIYIFIKNSNTYVEF